MPVRPGALLLAALLCSAPLAPAAAAGVPHAPPHPIPHPAPRPLPAPSPGEPPPLLRPAPLVSSGAFVRASAPGALRLVDGVYRAEAWGGGHPTPEQPAWVAMRLYGGYRRILVTWTSSHNHDYFEQFYGAPRDYRVETSGDSTDGRDGHWTLAADVRGNPTRCRAHAVGFEGQRWVRLTFTALPEKVNPWGLFLDELEVHDLSSGDDVWVFLGDSIGAGVFDRAAAHRPAFPDWIAAAHPGYRPVLVNAGLPRLRSWEAVDRVDEVLALNPDARVVAVTIGSNDADLPRLREALLATIRKIRAAGKIPLLSRMPFQTKYGQDYVLVKNEVVDEVVRLEGLLPGPDLYGWFKAHPEQLHDGLHPDGPGSSEMQRLWAEAAAPLYPPAPPRP